MSVYQGINDIYLPAIPNPSLQQYDNYQIHDIYCEDIVYQPLTSGGQTVSPPPPIKKRNFLAVEKVNPRAAIECDFNAIAIAYP